MQQFPNLSEIESDDLHSALRAAVVNQPSRLSRLSVRVVADSRQEHPSVVSGPPRHLAQFMPVPLVVL